MAVNPHSEPAKMEQIITEFFAKSLHIILESRCPYVSSRNYSGEQILHSPSSSSASSSSSMRPRDKWFNLALRDCPAALENIDFWRQSNLEPMVVDVVLVQRPHNWDYGSSSPKLALERNLSSKERFPFIWKSDSYEFGCDGNSEKIIERWVVQYESKKGCKEVCSGSKRSSSNSSHSLYKKSILLLRSLYVTVRLLPAYKIFREINSSGQIRTFSLIHRVSSSVEPLLLRRDEAEMQQFMFAPVDTSCGKLCISLSYLPSISDATSESSTPMSPQFIPDYVGSPLADPLKRLPSVPMPQYSPSSSPFGRRHSWSYDTNRDSPPSALPSPSPTYSESRTSCSKFGSHRPPTSSRYPLESAQVHPKDTSYDEYLPSPNFSPSSSPSPPMHLQGSNMLKALLRSDSAPVYIPTSRLGDAPLSSAKTGLPFSPPLKATRPSILQSATTAGKLLSLREEDIARPSGVKISANSSPHKSSSRLSFEDSYDDSEFSGPFVVDDDEVMDPRSRPGSCDQSGNLGTPHERVGPFTPRKSQDAAVGALVQILKKAPPLRQDLGRSQSRTESLCNRIQDLAVVEVGSSSMAASRVKTTSDALEELRAYMDMKQLLLRQSGKS